LPLLKFQPSYVTVFALINTIITAPRRKIVLNFQSLQYPSQRFNGLICRTKYFSRKTRTIKRTIHGAGGAIGSGTPRQFRRLG